MSEPTRAPMSFWGQARPASEIAWDRVENACTYWLSTSNTSVHLPSDSEVVIVEGTATPEEDRAVVGAFLGPYNAKYQWNLTSDDGGFLTVRPEKVLAWLASPPDSSPGEPSLFPRAASKWVWA